MKTTAFVAVFTVLASAIVYVFFAIRGKPLDSTDMLGVAAIFFVLAWAADWLRNSRSTAAKAAGEDGK